MNLISSMMTLSQEIKWYKLQSKANKKIIYEIDK